MNILPEWMAELSDEDISFVKTFILASGSLKEVSRIYEVTYPTVRLRLDRLIQKIEINEEKGKDPYILTIKRLALDERIDFDTAKILINEYKKTKES